MPSPVTPQRRKLGEVGKSGEPEAEVTQEEDPAKLVVTFWAAASQHYGGAGGHEVKPQQKGWYPGCGLGQLLDVRSRHAGMVAGACRYAFRARLAGAALVGGLTAFVAAGALAAAAARLAGFGLGFGDASGGGFMPSMSARKRPV